MQSLVKTSLGRLRKSQAGFTLVELLVVVAIIVALAAIIVPLVIQFAGSGDEGSAAGTLDTVQTSLDAGMANLLLDTLTDCNSTADAGCLGPFLSISDFSTEPSDLLPGLTAYMRSTSTAWQFCWDSRGNVSHPAGVETLDTDAAATCP